MFTIGRETFRIVLAAFVSIAVLAVTAAGAASTATSNGIIEIQFANGVDAKIYTADYLADRTQTFGSRGLLDLESAGYLALITDINDSAIINKGDGRFHPFGAELVSRCLRQIDCPATDLEVELYLLPYPRVGTLSSSASGSRVFLSPHVLEISQEGAAYIIAHEMGHVFQDRYFPDTSERLWNEYRRIRGIENTSRYSHSSTHAYRPHEIFAEDFRVLFGGPWAYFGGRVENPELISPTRVDGLEPFILALATGIPDQPSVVSFGGFPNPFNPQTELRVQLSDEFMAMNRAVTVRVYDVTGALVRDLYHGRPAGPTLRVPWDGRDNYGTEVASATYFGVVEAGETRLTTKLLMLK